MRIGQLTTLFSIHLVMFLVSSIAQNESTSIESQLGFFPDETLALLHLREALNLKADWAGSPCLSLSTNDSRWHGIGCRDGHVTRIVLDSLALSGSLPPTFPTNLPALTKLSLRNNFISGPLPSNLPQMLPNLQYLQLSNNRFSGWIPQSYTNLRSLIEIELQYNLLTGELPPFNQSSVTKLNVSHNGLQGRIPKTRLLRIFPANCYIGNADLCGNPLNINPCNESSLTLAPAPAQAASLVKNKLNQKNSSSLHVWGIVLIAAGSALLFLFLAILVCLHLNRRSDNKDSEDRAEQGENAGTSAGPAMAAYTVEKKANHHHHREKERLEDREEGLVELQFCDRTAADFDMDDLLRASAEEIGKGRLGITFKAMPETGPIVAVKRLTEAMNGLGRKEFIQQLQLLGNVSSNHENLARVISFYYSKEEKLIVSEFVPHGNLFQLLHENGGAEFRVDFSWKRRLSIVKGIAKGLSYLHHESPLASQKVPHANLKSSNILIQRDAENNYQPKLTDFGFLPLLSSRKSSAKLAVGRSPEFFSTSTSNSSSSMTNPGAGAFGRNKLTHKADVYCFGIVLLEVVTGRVPGQISPGGDDDDEDLFGDLSDWVRMVVHSDWTTDILDAQMRSEKEEHNEMLKLTKIALECTNLAPEKRPKMSDVVRRIEEIEQRSSEHE